LKIAIEIVDFPIKNGGFFHRKLPENFADPPRGVPTSGLKRNRQVSMSWARSNPPISTAMDWFLGEQLVV